MYQLKLPFAGFVVLGPSILPLITAVWVFALTNAVNLIDGLDGLAAGIVAIASGTLCRLRAAPRRPGAVAASPTSVRSSRR
jgi:UDP-N-acetylmuramyl pentapeptide phosphotransferase/UDP-N-acetylglucosamine-1-phosphate transferase